MPREQRKGHAWGKAVSAQDTGLDGLDGCRWTRYKTFANNQVKDGTREIVMEIERSDWI